MSRITGSPRASEPAGPLLLESKDPSATRTLAAVIAAHCEAGDVLLLIGDLGAGKTTFAQGFAAALGVSEAVTSPTFTLVRQYPLAGGARPGPGTVPLHLLVHADLYRLDHLGDVVELGLRELVDGGAVALVEWGDLAMPVLGHGALTVRFQHPSEGVDEGGDEVRLISLTPTDARWLARWPGLRGGVAPWLGRGQAANLPEPQP